MDQIVASNEMVVYCFDTLLSNFTKAKVPPPAFRNHECPLFVTWHKKSRSWDDTRLRGCIGTFSSQAIHRALKDYALTSALRDRRFSSVTHSEVPSLHCTVSLLVQFEPCGLYDWEIGRHGLLIEYSEDGETSSGTYLPEVCPEQGWTKDECIDSLIRKSGYEKRITDSFKQSLKVTRYQSSRAELTYDEYLTFRKKPAE